MFGTFRLILAILVALSHFGLVRAGLNPGQWAVIGFYVLSGFLMERQVRKLDVGRGPVAFYVDRLLRIFPLYLLVLAFAYPLFATMKGILLPNALLLPLNYVHFTGVELMIGPAWSLACEFHFYFLVPFLVKLSTRLLRAITGASVLLFAASPFLPNSTFWAYTGLPGILFTFCCGILLARSDYSYLNKLTGVMAALFALFLLSKVRATGLPTGIHINVCIGFLACLPVIRYLSRLSPKAPVDKALGLLSFPLFLCHESVGRYGVQWLHLSSAPVKLILALCAAGVLVLCVEIPVDRLRYRVRKGFQGNARPQAKTPETVLR